MANLKNLRASVVEAGLKEHALAVITAIANAEKYVTELTDAQDGATDLAWGRILYGLGDSTNTTLVVDATARTISCISGAGLFSTFKPGRNVQVTGFVNGGNNVTNLITAVSADSITLGNVTTFVDETDLTARAQENTITIESDFVADVTDVKTNFPTLTVTQLDALRNWIW